LNQAIKESLEKIYSQIPNFNCQNCHQCCGPIIWFKPEEILIREYLKKYKIKHVVWTKKEFEKNNRRCPYLINDKCIIYPVRPIVCRLQGNIPELKCKSSSNNIKSLSINELENIKKEFFQLVRLTNGMNTFYSSLKL